MEAYQFPTVSKWTLYPLLAPVWRPARGLHIAMQHCALGTSFTRFTDGGPALLASFIALRDTCELLGAARRDGLRVSPAGGRVDEAPLLRVVCPHSGQQEDSWNGYFSVRILMLSSEF